MQLFFLYISIQHGETLVDEQGNVIQTVDAIKPPKGWNWSTKDGWKVDLNRAVDHDGKGSKRSTAPLSTLRIIVYKYFGAIFS